jgi:hypothetical protein
MGAPELDAMRWLHPWQACAGGLEAELRREVGPGHVLYGLRAVSIARRVDDDEILFHVPRCHLPFAVVHLSGTRRTDADSIWPETVLYRSLDDWSARCMEPDHAGAERR